MKIAKIALFTFLFYWLTLALVMGSQTGKECGDCDWNVWYFQTIRDNLEQDLKSQSKISRYNLGWLRVELDIHFECAQRVCRSNQDKLKGIKEDYRKAFAILNSGELRSSRPLVDPLPPHLR